MRIFDFFTIIYDEVFILQLLAVSFSIVWIFYDWKKETKNIAIGIAYICGTFLVGTLLNWLLFALSTVWRAVAGIHFQIAWLLTIFLYLHIDNRVDKLISAINESAESRLHIAFFHREKVFL